MTFVILIQLTCNLNSNGNGEAPGLAWLSKEENICLGPRPILIGTCYLTTGANKRACQISYGHVTKTMVGNRFDWLAMATKKLLSQAWQSEFFRRRVLLTEVCRPGEERGWRRIWIVRQLARYLHGY